MLGQIPYVDFYVLVFPLGMQIDAGLLSVLGDQLLTLRLVGIVVSVVVGVLVYSASRKLGTSPLMCVLPVSGVILAQHVSPYNSYTWFALLFLSAAMLVHLTEWQKLAVTRDQSSHFSRALATVGFLLGLAILSKQNIGFAGLLAATVLVFVFGSQHQLSSYRIRIAQTGSMLLGFVIPIAAELMYLGYHDALPAFFQNAVHDILIFQADANLSVSDAFSNPLVGFALLALVVVAPALSALAALARPADGDMRVVLLVSLYGLGASSVVYPRPDLSHLMFASCLALLGPAYWVSDKRRAYSRKSILSVSIGIATLWLIIPLTFASIFGKDGHTSAFVAAGSKRSSLNHFSQIPVPDDYEVAVNEVNSVFQKYVLQGKTIYFLDRLAALYYILNDGYGHYYMIPLLGNFGANGVATIIENINRDQSAMVILHQETHPLESRELIQFVQESLTLTESVEGYDFYVR